MYDLVYVKYKQKLLKRHHLRDETDSISLNDIIECNEWLVEEMDDDEAMGNDFVFNDDSTLDWATTYEASGIGWPRIYTRRTMGKRIEPSNSVRVAKTSKKGTTSRMKEKVVEELELENYEEFKEEESLFNFEVEGFGGEEQERYASLDDNYVA